MYDREFKDKLQKVIITRFFTIIFLIGVIFAFIALDKEIDNVSSRFDTAIEEYTAKGYVICDVKVKLNQYRNVAVDKNEIDSYKEKESFMMSLHALSTDNVYIVSTDDITGITIHAEKEGADNE